MCLTQSKGKADKYIVLPNNVPYPCENASQEREEHTNLKQSNISHDNNED